MDRKLFYLASTIITTILITGCADDKYNNAEVSDSWYTQKKADEYLNHFFTSNEPKDLLHAANAYWDSEFYDRTGFLLKKIDPSTLAPPEADQYYYLSANMALLNKDYKRATSYLNEIEELQIQDIEFAQAVIKLRDKINRNINSSQYASLGLINDKNEVNDETWKRVTNLPKETLEKLYSQSYNNEELQGWIKLAQIVTDENNQLALSTKLEAWQDSYPNHPANRKFKHALQEGTPVNKIAILLPTSSPLHNLSQAIEEGFFKAYYEDRRPHKPKIKLIDTAQHDINQEYQHALEDGAEIVIGPLQKEDVDKIALQNNLSAPVISLNYGNNNIYREGLFQFGISFEDEAVQVAHKMQQHNLHKTLVLMPDSAWGKKMYKSFAEAFRSSDGSIVDVKYYSGDMEKIATDVSEILKVSESSQRHKALAQHLQRSLKFSPYRRKDIDSIFLIAKPQYARQVNSLLQFYFADDLPVYATSSIFNGKVDPKMDRDLEGIIFCDIPWSKNQDQGTTKHPEYSRLRALGYDAYLLSRNFHDLNKFAQLGLSAHSGMLFINNHNHIERNLSWFKIKNGVPSEFHG